MTAAAKSYISTKREVFKKKRPGIHSKNNSSGVKSSKNYLKKYVGQGRN
jgi:hypothetical protein